ncbi:MAG: YbbR-like domain-containing protein [Labilithrix sp.]|nr:YbbR-like domain-containing protein [Labilithrix sp.]MBX3223226.1 YbbR-like domain-containing protein [Labilithrix sp.]
MWDRIKAMLTENLNLKLLSFAFALVLYSLVHGGQDARGSISVDLEVNLPPESGDKVFIGTIPRDVRIFVRGSAQTIDNLRGGAVHMILDLTSSPDRVVFSDKMVRLPEGVRVEIEQFEPPSIDLKWEQRVTRDVPVQVSVVGAPADGYVVKGPLVADPKTVKVRGPQSDVMVLQHVRAEAFDVRTLTAEGQYPRQLAIERPNPRLRVDPQSVIVTAEIAREVSEQRFQKLPVVVVGAPKGKTMPAEVDVRLVCPPEIGRSLRAEQIVPQVEVTSKEPSGTMSLPVVVRIDKCEAYTTPPSVAARWAP